MKCILFFKTIHPFSEPHILTECHVVLDSLILIRVQKTFFLTHFDFPLISESVFVHFANDRYSVQVPEACPAAVLGGGCCGNGQNDPPSPHRIPRRRGLGPFRRLCRPAATSDHVGPRLAQRGLSHRQELRSGSGLRRGRDRA